MPDLYPDVAPDTTAVDFTWDKYFEFDNAYRCSLHPFLRLIFDKRFNIPIGHGSTDEDGIREMLRQADVMGLQYDNAVLAFGCTPKYWYSLRGLSTDPKQFTLAQDLQVPLGSPRPFGKWYEEHSNAWQAGKDTEDEGIGTLWPNDGIWPLGAEFSETVANSTSVVVHNPPSLMNTSGEVTIQQPSGTISVRRYKKVAVLRPYGHVEYCWTRIA